MGCDPSGIEIVHAIERLGGGAQKIACLCKPLLVAAKQEPPYAVSRLDDLLERPEDCRPEIVEPDLVPELSKLSPHPGVTSAIDASRTPER